MARPKAPCGTLSAYRRHLREGDKPCAQCTQANRDAQREKVKKMAASHRVAPSREPAPEAPAKAPAKSSARADLEMARDALAAAIDEVRREDPTRLVPLVRELRETWKALAVVAGDSESEAVEDEFARARRLRAERQAGA